MHERQCFHEVKDRFKNAVMKKATRPSDTADDFLRHGPSSDLGKGILNKYPLSCNGRHNIKKPDSDLNTLPNVTGAMLSAHNSI